jgi:hypothetical protein
VAKSEAERKRERLAAALRENLKRRKAHKNSEIATPACSDREARPQTSGADALSPLKPPR